MSVPSPTNFQKWTALAQFSLLTIFRQLSIEETRSSGVEKGLKGNGTKSSFLFLSNFDFFDLRFTIRLKIGEI